MRRSSPLILKIGGNEADSLLKIGHLSKEFFHIFGFFRRVARLFQIFKLEEDKLPGDLFEGFVVFGVAEADPFMTPMLAEQCPLIIFKDDQKTVLVFIQPLREVDVEFMVG